MTSHSLAYYSAKQKNGCSHRLNVSLQHLTLTTQAAARPSNKDKGKARNARDGRTEVLSVLSNKRAVAADAVTFVAVNLQGRL